MKPGAAQFAPNAAADRTALTALVRALARQAAREAHRAAARQVTHAEVAHHAEAAQPPRR